MPVDISGLLINSAAAFGICVLWYEFTRWSFKTLINLHSEEEEEEEEEQDVSSTDSSFVYSIEESEGKSDDKPRLVTRKWKFQNKN